MRPTLKSLISVAWLLATTGRAQVYVQFDQSSSPPAIISNTTEMVLRDLPISTAAAPMETNIYRFAFWQLNGVRQPDELGRAQNPVPFIIREPTTAVAQFFNADDDADGDGVPDWFEWQFYGTTNCPATADTDGDGFTLAQEYTRDMHPGLAETITGGGVSARPSPQCWLMQDTNFVLFSQLSTPPGIVQSNGIVPLHGSWLLPDVYTNFGGYWFTGWYVNGARVMDNLGRGIGNISVTVTTTTTAVASFIPETQDLDGDGVPDWFEWQFYGTTNYPAAADTDGDGFTLADEYIREMHPNLVDTIADGGVSARVSPSTFYTFNDPAYLVYFQRSEPPGLLNSGEILATGTVCTLPDLYNLQATYRFGQWIVNDQRIADELDRSIGGWTIQLWSNTTAIAKFYHETEDLDGDGVPDWFEWQFYGTTNYPATADTDGDGFTLADEYIREMHPNLAETIVAGGISARAAPAVTVGFTGYLINSVPSGLINDSGVVPLGGAVTTTNLVAGLPGYGFGHWTVDGVRQVDATGAALAQITVTILSNVVITAHFYPVDDDTDGDGLPDWWEDRYFGHTTNATRSADADGDGFTNEQEWLTGTNPRDGSSFLRIVNAEPAGAGFVLRFHTVVGKLYRVEYTDSLPAPGPWNVLQDDIPGNGALQEVFDPLTAAPVARFYRVRLK